MQRLLLAGLLCIPHRRALAGRYNAPPLLCSPLRWLLSKEAGSTGWAKGTAFCATKKKSSSSSFALERRMEERTHWGQEGTRGHSWGTGPAQPSSAQLVGVSFTAHVLAARHVCGRWRGATAGWREVGAVLCCRVGSLGALTPARSQLGGSSKTCFKCGKPGHWSRDCTVRLLERSSCHAQTGL